MTEIVCTLTKKGGYSQWKFQIDLLGSAGCTLKDIIMYSHIKVHKHTPYSYNEHIYKELHEICHPLFKTFDIKFFGYMRLFSNGKFFAISTNLDWQRHFLNDLSCHGEEFQHQVLNLPLQQVSYFLWPKTLNGLKDTTLTDLYDTDVWNGLSIYKKNQDYVESWSFAGKVKDIHLNNFYINNLGILNKFITYFNQKYRILIDFTAESTLSRYSNFSGIHPEDYFLNKKAEELSQFLEHIALDKIVTIINGEEISFSKREMECLANLASGKSGKEIALILDISPRTVESYINNVKAKSNLKFKSDLIKLFENIKDT